jgi:hypothetical protein
MIAHGCQRFTVPLATRELALGELLQITDGTTVSGGSMFRGQSPRVAMGQNILPKPVEMRLSFVEDLEKRNLIARFSPGRQIKLGVN